MRLFITIYRDRRKRLKSDKINNGGLVIFPYIICGQYTLLWARTENCRTYW
jgi:hypothetical protein